MPFIMQMLGFALLLLGLAVALWVSFWVLLVLFGAAVIVMAYSYLRTVLLAKGILNPTPGVRPAPMDGEHITIVDATFERVEEKK